MSFLSLAAPCMRERNIERSRFLAYAAHTAGEEEARAFLAGIRTEHPLATHVCYAFIADRTGNLQRFSDDGEPQGTAGMPILNVLKAQALFEAAVAVVRYFGGVKLGAGGLTRAYSSLAAEVLAAAPRAEYDLCRELLLCAGYAEINALLRFCEGKCLMLKKEFLQDARFCVRVREREAEGFSAGLKNALGGKVQIFPQNAYFSPFPLEK